MKSIFFDMVFQLYHEIQISWKENRIQIFRTTSAPQILIKSAIKYPASYLLELDSDMNYKKNIDTIVCVQW